MNKSEISELVHGVGSLVSLPDVFMKINKLVEDPDSEIADIVAVVNQDPGFTVRLLRVANSSFYGFSSTISTVTRAVSIIGTAQIRSLALATSVASTFEGLPNSLVSMANFWRHSLYCALIARNLAKQAKKCDADAVFTAALLHDIGELIIFYRRPDQAKAALQLVLDSSDELPIYIAEEKVLGFNHAEVGAELARQWKLPPMLEECIGFHHNLDNVRDFPREVALVHIANVLALMAELHTLNPLDVEPIDPRAWEIIGLDAEHITPKAVTDAQAEISEAQQLFFGEHSA